MEVDEEEVLEMAVTAVVLTVVGEEEEEEEEEKDDEEKVIRVEMAVLSARYRAGVSFDLCRIYSWFHSLFQYTQSVSQSFVQVGVGNKKKQ